MVTKSTNVKPKVVKATDRGRSRGLKLSEVEGFPRRLDMLIGGKWTAFQNKSGVPKASLIGYVQLGKQPRLDSLIAIATAAGVSVEYLATGSSSAAGPRSTALDMACLQAAIEIVEDWLDEHQRQMTSGKRAELASKIYELLVEDMEAGGAIDRPKMRQFLRLVA
ncbi:MAG: hypothetical protein QM651_16875 [Rhodoblastus sp.]